MMTSPVETSSSSFAKTAQERESFRPVAEATGTVDVPRFTDHHELAAPRHCECLSTRERDVRIVGTGNYNTSKSKPQHRNRRKTCGSGWKARSLGIAGCYEKRSTDAPRGFADSPMRDQRAPGAVCHKHRIRFRERERLIKPRDPIGAVRLSPIVLTYAKQRLVP